MTDTEARTSRAEDRIGWLLLGLAVAFHLLLLLPELRTAGIYPSDAGLHLPAIERLARAFERGESILDCWVSEWGLGYPLWRSYQPLSHLGTFFVWLLLFKTLSIVTLYGWITYLLLSGFPLCCWLGLRWMGGTRLQAGAVAAVSGLVTSRAGFGVELGSHVWLGSGLYAQLWAQCLLPLAVGRAFHALRSGEKLWLAGILGGAVFLAHFLYGYVFVLSAVLAALTLSGRVPRLALLGRLLVTLSITAALSAFAVLPTILASEQLNLSAWEKPHKWHSYGHATVLSDLLSGDLLDHGRLPLLTLLCGLGLLAALWRFRRDRQRFLLVGFLFWLALYCGRPTWGIGLRALGVVEGFHLHRLIGAVHFFALLLAGCALAGMLGIVQRLGSSRRFLRVLLPLGAGLLLLVPPGLERASYLVGQRTEGHSNGDFIDYHRREKQKLAGPLQEMTQEVASAHGRFYAGLGNTWALDVDIGGVPMFSYLSFRHEPAVGFLYHSMGHAAEEMALFDERRPAQYRLFGISRVVAPRDQELPGFLVERTRVGPWKILDAPGDGYFGIVDTPLAFVGPTDDAHELCHKWLLTGLVGRGRHLRLALRPGEPDLPMIRIKDRYAEIPTPLSPAARGKVLGETRQGEVYEALVEMETPGHLLFRMNFHPGWKATVDGQESRTDLLSPFFLGVPLGPGKHRVRLEYEAGNDKLLLLLLGALFTLCMFFAERRRGLARLGERVALALDRLRAGAPGRLAERLRPELGPLLLCLVAALLMSRELLVAFPLGHDATAYPPRLVEFHENLRHGILWPSWAPDLSGGYGQPLFVFSPPLFYWVAELFFALGMPLHEAIPAAVSFLMLASALTAYLLGRSLFGRWGGALTAVAYVTAPYLLLDAYVRSAWSELSAFPFLPLSLWGLFGLRQGSRPAHLVAAALGLGLVGASHHPALLLFAGCFVLVALGLAWNGGGLSFLLRAGFAGTLGLMLAAPFWLPALGELGQTRVDALLAGPLHYRNHFVYLHQLVWSPWGYGLSLPGPEDGMSFRLGLVHLGLAVLGFLKLRGAGQRPLAHGLLALLLVSVFFTTAESILLWDHLRLLQYLQFPWRMLGIASLVLALLVAALASSRRRGLLLASILLAGALPLAGMPGEKKSVPFEDAFFTPERIAAEGITTTTREEFTPKTCEALPPPSPLPASWVRGEGKVTQELRTPERRQLRVSSPEGGELRLHLLHFPGWEAWLDETPANTRVEQRSGLILLHVPPGEHVVDVRFADTPLRDAGRACAVAACALLLLLVWLRRRRASAAP